MAQRVAAPDEVEPVADVVVATRKESCSERGVYLLNKMSGLFERLRELSSDAADFLHLFISTVFERENPDIVDYPEKLASLFQKGIYKQDMDDLSELFDDLVKSGYEVEVKKILNSFRSFAQTDALLKAALNPLFERFLGRQGKAEKDVKPEVEAGGDRISTPAKLLTYNEAATFLIECGLEETQGQGDHKKWIDPSGRMKGAVIVDEGSKTLWRRKLIQTLLMQDGFDIQRIVQACKILKISYKLK